MSEKPKSQDSGRGTPQVRLHDSVKQALATLGPEARAVLAKLPQSGGTGR